MNMLKQDTIINSLRDLFGKRFSDKLPDRVIYSGDVWIYHLIKSRKVSNLHLPLGVVWPTSEEEISDLVNLAREKKFYLIPYGGGAGATGASVVVSEKTIVVDLKKMKEILEIDEESMTARVQTGIISQHLEDKLNRRGLMFPHYPMSMWTSTLGGFMATRASGIMSTKYGNIDDLILGFRVVTGRGEIIEFKDFPKTSVGPDLKRLFLGSEGTLGFFTEATIRLYRLPDERYFAVFSFKDIKSGIEFMREIIQRGLQPALLRFYDEFDTTTTFSHFVSELEGNLMLVMFDDEEEISKVKLDLVKKLAEKYRAKELNDEIGYKWWEKRYHKYLAAPTAARMGIIDTIEVATKWGRLQKLYDEVKSSLESNEAAVMAHFSHFYQDSAAVYFTIITEYGEEDLFEPYRKAWETVMEICLKNNATISHHHGVGLLRLKWLDKELGKALDLLLQLKRLLDPDNVLNPGKLTASSERW